MKTAYSQAWTKFKNSQEFTDQLKLMKEAEPRTGKTYLENRIRRIFDAGYNAGQEDTVNELSN